MSSTINGLKYKKQKQLGNIQAARMVYMKEFMKVNGVTINLMG